MKVYRVIKNIQANDFNDEDEYIIKTYMLNTKTNKLNLLGTNLWHDNTYDWFETKQQAQYYINNMKDNNIDDFVKLLNKEIEELKKSLDKK